MAAANVNAALVAIENLTSNFSKDENNVTAQHLDETLILNQKFKPVIDYLLLTVLIVIMLSMGCEITWSQVCRFRFFYNFHIFRLLL